MRESEKNRERVSERDREREKEREIIRKGEREKEKKSINLILLIHCFLLFFNPIHTGGGKICPPISYFFDYFKSFS